MTTENTPSTYQLLKTNVCKNLSGKADITYEIGCDEASNIFFRITNNTGGGWFTSDWIAFDSIMSCLENPGNSLTSYSLLRLYKGKSVNTPAFLFAALMNEGLVANDGENPRAYVKLPHASFLDDMKKLATQVSTSSKKTNSK